MREYNTQVFRWLAFKVLEEDHHVGEPGEVGGDQVGRVLGTGSLSLYLEGYREAVSQVWEPVT